MTVAAAVRARRQIDGQWATLTTHSLGDGGELGVDGGHGLQSLLRAPRLGGHPGFKPYWHIFARARPWRRRTLRKASYESERANRSARFNLDGKAAGGVYKAPV